MAKVPLHLNSSMLLNLIRFWFINLHTLCRGDRLGRDGFKGVSRLQNPKHIVLWVGQKVQMTNFFAWNLWTNYLIQRNNLKVYATEWSVSSVRHARPRLRDVTVRLCDDTSAPSQLYPSQMLQHLLGRYVVYNSWECNGHEQNNRRPRTLLSKPLRRVPQPPRRAPHTVPTAQCRRPTHTLILLSQMECFTRATRRWNKYCAQFKAHCVAYLQQINLLFIYFYQRSW